jgi:hypothetical protein
MIDIHLSGTNKAECDGFSVTGRGYSGPVGPLARGLLEKGYTPLESVTVYRESRVVFQGQTLQWWADRTFKETEYRSCHVTKYQPLEYLHKE